MEKSTNITPSTHDSAEESLFGLSERLEQIRDTVIKITEAIINNVIPILRSAVMRFYNYMLYMVATSREWYLMNHAKRKRVRKKYKNRLVRKLTVILSEDDTNG